MPKPNLNAQLCLALHSVAWICKQDHFCLNCCRDFSRQQSLTVVLAAATSGVYANEISLKERGDQHCNVIWPKPAEQA